MSLLYRHITTPIFYPNASPHLGHLYSSLLADVQFRWDKFKGRDSRFTTGTDEHGLKIQQAALKNGFKDPLQFVDSLVPQFKQLDEKYAIAYSTFIRTTQQNHIDNVTRLWQLCQDKGYIYEDTHQGWYSVSDETFYPESKVAKQDNGKYLNTETNNEVTYHKEMNYFFKLSAFQDRLIELLSRTGGQAWVYPESKRIQLLNELKSTPLQDLSISRPSERLSWAIPVPKDSAQSVYVWFDALTNYISALGPIDTVKTNPYWTQTTHIIGKDIMKFHCWYWPSFLIAAQLPLPRRVVIHDHWLSQGVKMSKSLGNVIDPMSLTQMYGRDIVRWAILENSQVEHDNNFKHDDVVKCRSMFVSKWGNLINRCCNPKGKFDLGRAVTQTCQAISNEKDFIQTWESLYPGSDVNQIKSIFTQLSLLQESMDTRIDEFKYSHILKDIWQLIDQLNLFIQTMKPWDKSLPHEKQDMVIYLAMDICRILSILSQPFIPQLSNIFLDRIDVLPERRTVEDAKFGADKTYGMKANDPSKRVPIQRDVASYEYQ